MARSRNTADTQTASGGPVSPNIAGKNAVINGGFDVWQRGTSLSLSTTGTVHYTSDRWCLTTGTNQALTISRQATNDTTNLPNIQYCLRFQRNSGQTGTAGIPLGTNLETSQSVPLAGKTVTMSFYARAGANYSATSSILQSYIITGTGTDQNTIASSYTGINLSINQNNTLTTTWQRFTITGTLPTNTSEICAYFAWTPTGTAGANDYFEITGVQLELGSVATPFSRAGGTIQGELAACQRYYWRATPGGIYSGYANGMATATTVSYSYMAFPVQMRITPTSIDYSNIGFGELQNGIIAASSVNLGYAGTASIFGTIIQVNVSSGLVQYRAGIIANTNNAAGYLGLSAEL